MSSALYAESPEVPVAAQNSETEGAIPFKQDSEVVTRTAINSFMFIAVLILIAFFILYSLKKKGVTLPFMIKPSNKINILSRSSISNRTTILRVSVEGEEFIIFESKDNIHVEKTVTSKEE